MDWSKASRLMYPKSKSLDLVNVFHPGNRVRDALLQCNGGLVFEIAPGLRGIHLLLARGQHFLRLVNKQFLAPVLLAGEPENNVRRRLDGMKVFPPML